MQYKDVVKEIAKLVGYEFKSMKFERIALEGGEVFVTNQLETPFTIGDVIYVESEDGFILAPVGSHILEDGREIVLDEESAIVEIREEGEENGEDNTDESEVVIEAEEITVEVPEEVEDVLDADIVEDIIEALTPIIEEIKDLAEELRKLKKDFKTFKSEEVVPSIKANDHKFKQSVIDWKVEMVEKLKSNKLK